LMQGVQRNGKFTQMVSQINAGMRKTSDRYDRRLANLFVRLRLG
jgi:hypothetical protein